MKQKKLKQYSIWCYLPDIYSGMEITTLRRKTLLAYFDDNINEMQIFNDYYILRLAIAYKTRFKVTMLRELKKILQKPEKTPVKEFLDIQKHNEIMDKGNNIENEDEDEAERYFDEARNMRAEAYYARLDHELNNMTELEQKEIEALKLLIMEVYKPSKTNYFIMPELEDFDKTSSENKKLNKLLLKTTKQQIFKKLRDII